MSLRDLLRVLYDRRTIVAVLLVLGLGAGALLAVYGPKTYTATTTLYVSSTGAIDDRPLDEPIIEQRVKSYESLLTSPSMSADVVALLNLDESPEKLAARITAANPTGSALLEVAVRDPDPQQAAAIADGIGQVFPPFVRGLEATSGGPEGPPVVRVVRPVSVPTQPSSLGAPVVAVLGLLVGLVVGVLAALAAHAVDKAVRRPEQLGEAAGVPVLGMIRDDPAISRGPLDRAAASPAAEDFRQLRAALHAVPGEQPKVVMVVSAIPGEGRTTTACNIAAAAAAVEGRVLLVDADLRWPAVAHQLRLTPSTGLSDVLLGRASSAQLQTAHGFDVITSGDVPAEPGDLVASAKLTQLISDARSVYDLIVVDVPALLPVSDALSVATSADAALVVCRVGTSRSDVRRAVELLSISSCRPVGAVLVRTRVGRPRPEWYLGAPKPAVRNGHDAPNTSSGVTPTEEPGTVEPEPAPDSVSTLAGGPDRAPVPNDAA